jgi:hypothetical protein
MKRRLALVTVAALAAFVITGPARAGELIPLPSSNTAANACESIACDPMTPCVSAKAAKDAAMSALDAAEKPLLEAYRSQTNLNLAPLFVERFNTAFSNAFDAIHAYGNACDQYQSDTDKAIAALFDRKAGDLNFMQAVVHAMEQPQ